MPHPPASPVPPAAHRAAPACRTCTARRCSLGTAFSPAADHAALGARLENVGDRVAAARGHIVLGQGDRVTHALLLEAGVLKVTRVGGGGEETVVDVLGPGSLVGLQEALTGGVSPSYLTAAMPCTIRRVSRAQLTRALREDAELGATLIGTLAATQSRALDQIAALKAQDAEQRIIRFLSATCPLPRGEVTMELPIDRATLAWWLGIRPESLSRSFRKLRALGVTSELRFIRIASLERLRDAVEAGETDETAAA